MVQNLNVFDFNLTPSEINQINNLKDKPKKIDDKGAHTHPDYPFFESMELSDSSTRSANLGLLGSMNLLILMIFFYSIACYF